MAALPLLCAARACERLGTFLIQPTAAQEAIFGRVVANPWQIRQVNSWISEDGVSKGWNYTLPTAPIWLTSCAADGGPKPRGTSADYRSCSRDWEGGYLKAEWDKGMLGIWFDPAHIDPDDRKPAAR